ncbi:MAG: hypothetical protein RL087_1116 [Pseudomonadota bacterium]
MCGLLSLCVALVALLALCRALLRMQIGLPRTLCPLTRLLIAPRLLLLAPRFDLLFAQGGIHWRAAQRGGRRYGLALCSGRFRGTLCLRCGTLVQPLLVGGGLGLTLGAIERHLLTAQIAQLLPVRGFGAANAIGHCKLLMAVGALPLQRTASLVALLRNALARGLHPFGSGGFSRGGRGPALAHSRQGQQACGDAGCHTMHTRQHQHNKGGKGTRHDAHHRTARPSGPGRALHVRRVSTVRRSSARNSADCISLRRETVRGNSCASGPSV